MTNAGILGLTLVFATLGDGMSKLQAELEQNDAAGTKLVAEKQELDTGVAALAGSWTKLEGRAVEIKREADDRFQPAKQAVEAAVDGWNARCGGERPEPVYNACVAERGPIEAERERVQ